MLTIYTIGHLNTHIEEMYSSIPHIIIGISTFIFARRRRKMCSRIDTGNWKYYVV